MGGVLNLKIKESDIQVGLGVKLTPRCLEKIGRNQNVRVFKNAYAQETPSVGEIVEVDHWSKLVGVNLDTNGLVKQLKVLVRFEEIEPLK